MSLLWLNNNVSVELSNKNYDIYDLIVKVNSYSDVQEILDLFTKDNLKHIRFVPDDSRPEIEDNNLNVNNFYVTTNKQKEIEIHFDLNHISDAEMYKEKIDQLNKQIDDMNVIIESNKETVQVAKILTGEE